MNTTPPSILIVDDISCNIEVLSEILLSAGYDVSTAGSGYAALEMPHLEKFDLFLLDVMMPGMDGFSLCGELKKKPETKETPVIFITAKSETADLIKGFSAGAVDYIIKPFQAGEVRVRVNTHCELKRTKDALKEKYNKEKKLTAELAEALSKVKMLSGLLPICCYCFKIKDSAGYWQRVDEYIRGHSEAEFTHGVCVECKDRMMKEFGL